MSGKNEIAVALSVMIQHVLQPHDAMSKSWPEPCAEVQVVL